MTDAATAAAPGFCLDGFLELLRTHRFQIGPDRCLRILRLLSHIDYRCDPSELERLICPLIATSAEEQERFGILFHTYYPFLPREAAESIEERAEITGSHPITGSHRRRRSSGTTIPPELPEDKPRRWTRRRVGVGLVATVGMVGVGIGVGPAVWRYINPAPPKPLPCEATNSCPKPPGPDTTSNKDSVLPQPPTIDTVLVSLALNEPTSTWYQRNQQWVRGLAMLLPVVLLVASEILRRRRRPPPVDDSAGPFFQPLQVPEPGRWYRSPTFFTAARMLRQRQLGEGLRLAVEQTISATIDRMGYPTWKYRRDTRPPEYLALIDRTGLRDHQARHFDSLVAGLKREGVILERYFFDGDPRLCHTDGMKEVIPLGQLERRYHGARLLLLGDCYRLLDPVNGELVPWTMALESWRERAILTPTPPIAWGAPESALEERFPLLAPATTEGLKDTVLRLAPDSGADRRDWKEESSGETPPPLHPERALRELHRALGKPVYRWLCACAVYPELRWDLTVHLGALPEVGANLVTERNLLALARLPWFRQGAIPEPVRAELIEDLPEEAKTAVRKELLKLLRHDLPPEGSPARRKFDAEIAVQQLGLATQDPAAAKALKPDLMRAPRDHFLAELEIGGLTESLPRSWVARLVPRRWWPVLFEHGLPAFSMHTGVRLAATFAAVAGAFLFLPRQPIPPSRLEITPDSAVLQVGKTTGRIEVASSKTVKYTSQDSAIVSVEGGGVLMPHDSGNSVIVAEAGGLSAALKVRVLSKEAPPEPPAVRIARIVQGDQGATQKDQLVPGGAIQLLPVLSDSSLKSPEILVSWRSLAPKVAQVSRAGVVTGVAAGRTRILAAGPRDTIAIDVTVLGGGRALSPIGISDVLLEPALLAASSTSLGPGAREMLDRKVKILRGASGVQLKVTGHAPTGIITSRTWATLAVNYLKGQGVAASQTDAPSKLWAMQSGEGAWGGLAFEAARGDTTAARPPEVALKIMRPQGVATDRAGRTLLMNIGDSVRFEVQQPPSRAILHWSSSNPYVLAIDPRSGDTRAVGAGEARVIGTLGATADSLTVRVLDRSPNEPNANQTNPTTPRRASSLRLRPDSATLQVGDSLLLEVDVGKADQISPARWASEVPSIATVDARGRVQGISAGVARIRVTVSADTAYAVITVEAGKQPIDPYNGGNDRGTRSATEVLLEQLRKHNQVSPLELKPGETGELHKMSPGPAYGFASAANLAGEKIGGPIMVRRDRSTDFNLEVHRLASGTIELVGFVNEEEAKLILVGSVTHINLGLGSTQIRKCVVPVPLPRVANLVYQPGTQGNPVLIITTSWGPLFDRKQARPAPPMLCLGRAAGK